MTDFKFIDEGDSSFTLQRPDGVVMPVAKSELSPDFQKELRGLPKVEASAPPATPAPTPEPSSTATPEPDMTQSLMNPNLSENQQHFQQSAQAAQEMPVPQSQQAQPDQNQMLKFLTGQMGRMGKHYGAYGAGIQQEAAAQSAGAAQTAEAQDAFVDLQQQQMEEYKKARADLDVEYDRLKEDVSSSKIDPTKWWNRDEGVGPKGRKVLAMIGMFLGGVGANKTGQNPYMTVVNKFIDDDIAAQEENLETKKSLLQTHMEEYDHLDSARAATRLDMNTMLQAQLGKIAAQTQSASVKAKAKIGMAELGLKIEELKRSLAQSMAQAQFMGGAGGSDSMVGFLSPEMQKRLVKVPGLGYRPTVSPDGAEAKEAREVVGAHGEAKKLIKKAREYLGVDDKWNDLNDGANPREIMSGAPKWAQNPKAAEAQKISDDLLVPFLSLVPGAKMNPKFKDIMNIPNIGGWSRDKAIARLKLLEEQADSLRNSRLSSTLMNFTPPKEVSGW